MCEELSEECSGKGNENNQGLWGPVRLFTDTFVVAVVQDEGFPETTMTFCDEK